MIGESDFHCDFVNLIIRSDTEYILLGVDDVVFFDSVDIELIDETFRKHAKDIFGFSLRFGRANIKDSNDPISEAVSAGQTVYCINWTQGRTPDTRYPFELCATVLPTALVKNIIGNVMNGNLLIKRVFSPGSAFMGLLGKSRLKRKILKHFGYFYSPNTLESWNCRWCQNHREQLPRRLYFQKLHASAIQVNMVNTSTDSPFNGSAELTVEVLNEKYKDGFRLDIDFVSKSKPIGINSGPEFFRLTRNLPTKQSNG